MTSAATSIVRPSAGAQHSPAGSRSRLWSDVSTAPVDAQSASYIAYINNGGVRRLHPDFGGVAEGDGIYGMPYAVVGAAQPKLAVQFGYADESDGVDRASGRTAVARLPQCLFSACTTTGRAARPIIVTRLISACAQRCCRRGGLRKAAGRLASAAASRRSRWPQCHRCVGRNRHRLRRASDASAEAPGARLNQPQNKRGDLSVIPGAFMSNQGNQTNQGNQGNTRNQSSQQNPQGQNQQNQQGQNQQGRQSQHGQQDQPPRQQGGTADDRSRTQSGKEDSLQNSKSPDKR